MKDAFGHEFHAGDYVAYGSRSGIKVARIIKLTQFTDRKSIIWLRVLNNLDNLNFGEYV